MGMSVVCPDRSSVVDVCGVFRLGIVRLVCIWCVQAWSCAVVMSMVCEDFELCSGYVYGV